MPTDPRITQRRPAGPDQDALAIGTRIRLKPRHDWLARFASLADNWRFGTITALPDDRTATVEFDMVKRGATPIVQTFARSDLIVCGGRKIEQIEIALPLAPADDPALRACRPWRGE